MKKQIGIVLTVLTVAALVGVFSIPTGTSSETVDQKLVPYQKVLDKLNAEHLTKYPLVLSANEQNKEWMKENLGEITPEKYETLLRAAAGKQENTGVSDCGLLVRVSKEKLAPYQAVVDKVNREYHLSLFLPGKTYNGDTIQTLFKKTPGEFEAGLQAVAKTIDPAKGPADVLRLLNKETYQGSESHGGTNNFGNLLLLEAEEGTAPKGVELIGFSKP